MLVNQAPSLGATTEADGGDSDGGDETESSLTKFRGLQFNFSSSQRNTERNRPRVFLATQYLRYCLQTLVHGNKELHKVNVTKNNKSIQSLAFQLNANDPEFKGVTAGALVSLYTKVVESKRCVESHLEASTSEAFIPTRFFDLAGELMAYDNDILEAKENQRATKDGRTIEESNKRLRTLDKSLHGRRTRLDNTAISSQQPTPSSIHQVMQPQPPTPPTPPIPPAPSTFQPPSSIPFPSSSFQQTAPCDTQATFLVLPTSTEPTLSTTTTAVQMSTAAPIELDSGPQLYQDPLAFARAHTNLRSSSSPFATPLTRQSSLSATESDRSNAIHKRSGVPVIRKKFTDHRATDQFNTILTNKVEEMVKAHDAFMVETRLRISSFSQTMDKIEKMEELIKSQQATQDRDSRKINSLQQQMEDNQRIIVEQRRIIGEQQRTMDSLVTGLKDADHQLKCVVMQTELIDRDMAGYASKIDSIARSVQVQKAMASRVVPF